jgi:hypothetical protein
MSTYQPLATLVLPDDFHLHTLVHEGFMKRCSLPQPHSSVLGVEHERDTTEPLLIDARTRTGLGALFVAPSGSAFRVSPTT